MDNITFGKYIPINSTIHQLDPRLKILTLLIFLIAIFFDAGFIGYDIMAIFTLAIEDLLNPLKKIGFPSHELAMMISIALRFIPDLLDEAKRIMKAQASRGVDFSEGKLTDKIKAIISLIIPLFISAFQRAEDLANAMESRNYNPEAKRTRYKTLKWRRTDTLAFIFTAIVSGCVITLSFIL